MIDRRRTDLGGELDSSSDTLGEIQVTLLGSSLDSVVEVGDVGSGRHVELVLLGEEPAMSAHAQVRPFEHKLTSSRWVARHRLGPPRGEP